jgi:dissimilatory sulfite reductase (desulfoviridin) alpha/beta subunit
MPARQFNKEKKFIIIVGGKKVLTNTEKQINVPFMNTTEAFLDSIKQSIASAEKMANSIPRKGMNVYLDKSTMVMQTFNDPSAFAHAKKVTARAGQSSCLRNVLDAGGRLQ